MTTPHKVSVDNGQHKVMRPGKSPSLARRARDTHLHSITFAFLHRGSDGEERSMRLFGWEYKHHVACNTECEITDSEGFCALTELFKQLP